MKLKKIKLPFKVKKTVLALGSQTKNTICFAKGNFAYLNPVHADLSSPQDYLIFAKDVKYFLKQRPKIIACDLHPEYQATKYAHNLPSTTYRLQPIQHHHAHIASCMAENGLKNEKVIGVAFDGTGLGNDNHIWGAEFLVADYKNFQRKARLQEIPLLGAEKAILEPSRLAFAWLYRIYKDKFLSLKINFVKGIDKERWRVLKKMYLSGFNSPLASSMGRLFDAVGSLVLGKSKVRSEAQLAIEFEKIATRYSQSVSSYKFNIIKNKKPYIIDPQLMFKEIVSDLKTKEAKEKIALRFHLTVAQMIRKMCLVLRKETKINKVVLSGGVFQNSLLLSLALDLLYKEGFRVFTHKVLSPNDSSISLGQAAIAGSIG
jgi:hydrogenase maturation protein HypF